MKIVPSRAFKLQCYKHCQLMNKFIAKRTLDCFYHTVFFTLKQDAQLSFAADDHPLFGLRHQLSRSLAGLARVCGLCQSKTAALMEKLSAAAAVLCVCVYKRGCAATGPHFVLYLNR